MQSLNKMQKVSIAGIVIGIIIVIMGITLQNTPLNTTESITNTTSYKYYGGDAYTGMQNAAADTSNNTVVVAEAIDVLNSNIKNLNDNMINAISSMIFSFGLAVIVFFVYKFVKYSNIQISQGTELSHNISGNSNSNMSGNQQRSHSVGYSLSDLAKSTNNNIGTSWKCSECGDSNLMSDIQCKSCGKYK